MSEVITDIGRIETLLSALSDMRNSEKGRTAIAILTDGTDQAKAAMQEQLDFYFDDEVKTVDDIKKWMAENTDDPDDDDFYGGSKE